MKTKESIEKKWAAKIEVIKKKMEFKYNILLQRRKATIQKGWEYEIEKNERKKKAAIKKKEEEYKRKMLNEIRELEWRPKREYKTEWPKIKPLKFSLELMQETVRLRDTDENGRGRCISCDKMCEWEWLAWGHRYSRRFQHICLEKENVNAQCHSCNWATWPRGDTVAKERVNNRYDENIDKKFWEWSAEKLKKKLMKTFKGTTRKYDFAKVVPELIKQNEELWASKSEVFRANHKPKRNWRHLWTEYDKRH